MLRVGIIGCGGIIERRHLPGLLELRDTVEIKAMSDISAERVDLLAGRLVWALDTDTPITESCWPKRSSIS